MSLGRSWFKNRTPWSRQLTENDPLSVPGVLAPTEIENAFRSERSRVDRNDRVFSVAVFTVDPKRATDARRAAEVLTNRVRTYDSIGVVDGGRLAVLLPESAGDATWGFVDSAIAEMAQEDLRVTAQVYSYPHHPGADADLPSDHAFRSSTGGEANGSANNGYRRVTGEDTNPTKDAGSPRPLGGERTVTLEGTSPATLSGGGPALQTISIPEPAPRPAANPVPPRPVHDLAWIFVERLPHWKRAIDIVVSGAAILLLAPLLAVTAILVKGTSPGPIIFSQWRAGRGERPFKFYKFRSMVNDAESRKSSLRLVNEKEGPIFKIKADPRITPVGRVIRRLSIDELPQLFNVLKGDMTLVGPRPPVMDEIESYERWQRQRLEITGGLTCIWQVSGRSEVSFDDWMRMDVRYKQRRTLRMDIRLIMKTFGAVFSGRGAY